MLSWSVACIALTLLTTAIYLLSLCLLSRLLPGDWHDLYKPAFLAIGLLFAPTQSALHVSNVTGLAAGLLLVAAFILITSDSVISIGVAPIAIGETEKSVFLPVHSNAPRINISVAALLTLSLCVKPTLGLSVLLYLICKRAWQTLTSIIVLTAAATVAFQFFQPNLNWLPSLRANINFLFNNGVASLAETNPTRSDRIDLQLPAYILTHSRDAGILIATIITFILLALSVRVLRRKTHSNVDHNLLILSTILILGLLPFYQRFYSGALLLLPALWAIRNLSSPRARWILALCSAFLVNTSVLPRRMGINSLNSNTYARLADIFITPHLCWVLLILVILLVSEMRNFNSAFALQTQDFARPTLRNE